MGFSVVLFGLTGFGNTAFRTLRRWDHDVWCVCTRKEPGPFPYHREIQLDAEVRDAGVPIRYDLWAPDLGCPMPDILLVATYHRKIPEQMIQAARVAALNVHPSLLPAHKGRHPIRAALKAGDHWTGITIHRLTDRWDEGEVLWQSKVPIPPDATEGSLRWALAGESARAIASVLDDLRR